jgi:hypothetical protein
MSATTVLPVRSRRLVEAQARAVVDYALARRATLSVVASGRTSREDVCDAQTYLVRAARYHGEPAGEACPMCKRDLVHVLYTYGDCFRSEANGRARATHELIGLADELPEFTVFRVEVCADCRWNHLVASYVLGNGAPAKRRARR